MKRSFGLVLSILIAPTVSSGAALPRDVAADLPALSVEPVLPTSEVVLRYQKNQPRTAPEFDKFHGRYLGSGTGVVSGEISGEILWDLYEDQTDPQLHRTQFVGRIVAADGSSIAFETAGYFVPHAESSTHWNLASAVYLFAAQGPAFRSLQGALGVWEGAVDTRTFSHRYQLRLTAVIGARRASLQSVGSCCDTAISATTRLRDENGRPPLLIRPSASS